MNSGDRAVSICIAMVCAALVAVVLLVSSCTVQQTTLNRVNKNLEVRSEHVLRAKCIDMHGTWKSDGYRSNCSFEK